MKPRRAKWIIVGSVASTILTVGIIVVGLLNGRLTRYVEGPGFHAEMEKETAKGLHFPSGHYGPIKRTGMWTAETAGFNATDGWKALKQIDAHGITMKFNPWGVFQRLWYLEEVHIKGGQIEIQVYEPRPEPSPPKPWYVKYLLPERVYLNHVESETADVTWRFRGKRAGIFNTRLLITPHDRDFEYQARDGWLRAEPFPELRVKHIHTLITKTELTLYNMNLDSNTRLPGRIHVEGKAGTRPENRSVDFQFLCTRLPIDEWVPTDWQRYIGGLATSHFHWTGSDTKLEHSAGEGDLRIDDGELHGLPFLQKLVVLTNDKSIERLRLNECRFAAKWHYPSIDIKDLALEEKGKWRAEGEVVVDNESLRGAIELGVAPRLLDFLTEPVLKEVFPREKNGYVWTTVHLSGTIEAPKQDLSERIAEAFKEHPADALQILFRQIGEALRKAFGGD